MDGFHLPISQLTYMSFCTQGLPGVAESTVSISEGFPSHWGEGARQGVWGYEKCFVWSSLTSAISILFRRGRVMLDDGFCDFAFVSAQNDREGGIMLRMKVFKLEKPN